MSVHAAVAVKVMAAFFTLLLASCAGLHTDLTTPFTYDNLIALDPRDASHPAGDVVAVYAREGNLGTQLRIDFLDLDQTKPGAVEVTLALFSAANSQSAGELVMIPALGDPRRIDSLGRTREFSARVIRDTALDAILIDIPSPPIAQIQITISIDSVTLDNTPRIDLNAKPPQPARLALAFTQTFEALTPAQALRSWDGAHTGPMGVRHGLKYLLEASEKYQVPVTLLDVCLPESWSALDFMGVGQRIDDLERRNSIKTFDREAYVQPNDPTLGGLSIDLKQVLLDQALNDPDTPVIVGGSLPDSAWGNVDEGEAGFAYIQNHPWIQPVLLSAAPQTDSPISSVNETYLKLKDMYRQTLASAQEKLASLPENTCDQDHCKIASGDLAGLIDLHGGFLMYLYSGKDQIIGPTAQFEIGISDSSQWDLSKGIGADSGQVMGAFIDPENPYQMYTPTWNQDDLILASADGKRINEYRLIENRLEYKYQGGAIVTRSPLVVKPEIRFQTGWADQYTLSQSANGIGWGTDNGISVWIKSQGAQINSATFLDSRWMTTSPENPNAENPPGHYLPFPMAMITITSQGHFMIIVTIEN